jgi:hypothetical protein
MLFLWSIPKKESAKLIQKSATNKYQADNSKQMN